MSLKVFSNLLICIFNKDNCTGDSDTGLESMSSAEQTNTITCTVNGQIVENLERVKSCSQCFNDKQLKNVDQLDGLAENATEDLKNEIIRLKCDKLDLLRQNVVSIIKSLILI